MSTSPQEVTKLLVAWRHGDQQALDRSMPLVYDELRRIASRGLSAPETAEALGISEIPIKREWLKAKAW